MEVISWPFLRVLHRNFCAPCADVCSSVWAAGLARVRIWARITAAFPAPDPAPARWETGMRKLFLAHTFSVESSSWVE
jgi:hypothetical protein